LGSQFQHSRFQMRVDANNLFNHQTLAGPNTTVTGSQFGQVTATLENGRWIRYSRSHSFLIHAIASRAYGRLRGRIVFLGLFTQLRATRAGTRRDAELEYDVLGSETEFSGIGMGRTRTPIPPVPPVEGVMRGTVGTTFRLRTSG
jgi:hypothetical protein